MPSRRSLHKPLLIVCGLALSACGSESKDQDKDPFTQSDSSISEAACDGQDLGSVERRVRYQAARVASDAECMAQDQMRTCGADGWSSWSGDYSVESCTVEGLASCDGMPHGTKQTRARYEAMSVAAGATCAKQDQTRACEDGTWSDWSGSFTFESCSVDGAANCGTSPDGTKEEQKRYEAQEVAFGTECKSEQQTRACSKGTWSAWTGTYTFESCLVKEALSCENTPHGDSQERTRFKADLVEANETCEEQKQTRLCSNGVWGDWTGTFAAEICDVKGKRRCDTTLHGESATRTMYETASVPFGSNCVAQQQTRTCNDATFTEWTGTFTNATCAAELPKACEGGVHGATRNRSRFQSAVAPFGTSCLPENQVSTCYNGVWSDYTGTYTAETCGVALPKACEGGAHGATRTRDRFKDALAPFGTLCQSETQTSTCYDGTWSPYSGTYTAETCQVAPPAPCDGKPSGSKEERDRFQAASVAMSATCVSEKQNRTCSNGTWGAWSGTYAAPTCKVRKRDCSRGAGTTAIFDGETESREHFEEAFPTTTCKGETQTRLCTDGTFAAWSGTFKMPGCSPPAAPATGVTSCLQPSEAEVKCREYTGANRATYEDDCTGGWSATRGCPVGGSVVGKCTGVTLQGDPTSNFFYSPTAISPQAACVATFGTWTEL